MRKKISPQRGEMFIAGFDANRFGAPKERHNNLRADRLEIISLLAETFIFRIHPGQVPAWEKGVREGSHPEARRLQINLESLSFGDGTGYFGNSGTAYPAGSKKQSGELREPEKSKKARSPDVRSNNHSRTATIADLPVRFLPANFLSLKSSTFATMASSTSEESCLFAECVGIEPAPRIHVCYNCPSQNRPTLDSAGICKEIERRRELLTFPPVEHIYAMLVNSQPRIYNVLVSSLTWEGKPHERPTKTFC